MARTQERKRHDSRKDEIVEEVVADKARTQAVSAKGKEVREAADKFMDEIDVILKENVELVGKYIQKGGE